MTWNLADAVSRLLVRQWTAELADVPDSERRKQLRTRINEHLDAGSGSQILHEPRAARRIHEALRFGHGTRYELHAWCVMPTHVHALLLPIEPWPLGKIIQGIKSVTSRQIARDLDLKASLWSPDYFDVWIRDLEHFERTLNYIEWNPVKAKLCQDPANWPHSSANETARKYVLSL